MLRNLYQFIPQSFLIYTFWKSDRKTYPTWKDMSIYNKAYTATRSRSNVERCRVNVALFKRLVNVDIFLHGVKINVNLSRKMSKINVHVVQDAWKIKQEYVQNHILYNYIYIYIIYYCYCYCYSSCYCFFFTLK